MGIDKVLKPKSEDEIQDLEQRGFRKDKGKWRFTIDIKHIIEEFDKNEDVEAFRKSIFDLLITKIDDIEIFADKESSAKFKTYVNNFKKLGKNPSVEKVDDVMDELYEWADKNDVWINSF